MGKSPYYGFLREETEETGKTSSTVGLGIGLGLNSWNNVERLWAIGVLPSWLVPSPGVI